MSEAESGATRRAGEHQATGWSLSLGSVLGVPVRVHFTFLLLLVLFGVAAAGQGRSFILAVLQLVLLFACVGLHELGHATAARAFGVKTHEIVLYPIGGVARLERIPEGWPEFFIAIAGPLVNVVIGAALVVVMLASGVSPVALPALVAKGQGLVPFLVQANVLLVVFNLIPAFPMDGGRVLRSLLALRLPPERATRIAASVGQGAAVVFAVWGLVGGNFLLLFIALFVFLGATQEAAFYAQRVAVAGHAAREAMITRFEVLAPQDPLSRAAALLLDSHQQDFPVVDAWRRVAGVLSRASLVAGLAKLGDEAGVLDVMDRDVSIVAPEADLEEVLQRFQANGGRPVLVMQDDELVGMITLENLLEFIQIGRSARRAEARGV